MKQPAKKYSSKQAKKSLSSSLAGWQILGLLLLLIALGITWHYRVGIKYYMTTVSNPKRVIHRENSKYDIRNVEIMSAHDEHTFGIDISQYQGDIRWDQVATINDQFPIDFIFIRATMGEQGKDRKFKDNWRKAGSRAKLRGAYHYFRPNENSVAQADNFVRVVKLKPGDLPPVLDIEEMPRGQSMEQLKLGLKRWLQLVENHYGVKPILYTGDRYYSDFLEKEFSGYTLWIANYNFFVENIRDHWHFWQFSERGTVRGIDEFVDLNIFNGPVDSLEALTIPYR